LQLGGERKTLTMLFSDLESFSLLAERLEPELLTTLLNDYLSDMTDIILDEGGTVDKYLGDAIVAFWNAPLDQPDHASRACRAALRCQQRLEERAEDYRSRSGSALKARIGIHTGEVIVGNMGSRTRFDYSMIGDAANLASRLESANKTFGTHIMVSEATWNEIEAEFAGREIGVVKVTGRTAPVRVFELAGQAGATTHYDLAAYNDAIGLYRAGRWVEAGTRFADMADDILCRLYADTCNKAHINGGWDGVWLLETK